MGTPLLEIVTEPDLESAEQCLIFARTLRNICRHLGVTEAIMQRGQMRFEPDINVIIEKDGDTFATPVVEIKSLNSFRSLHGAVEHEYTRQIEAFLETGRTMDRRAKTTRGWDDIIRAIRQILRVGGIHGPCQPARACASNRVSSLDQHRVVVRHRIEGLTVQHPGPPGLHVHAPRERVIQP